MPTMGIAGFAVEGLAPSTSAGGITFGRSTSRAFVPVPDSEPRKSKSGVNYREHGFIGDAIKLTFSGGRTLPASQKRFQLENSLQLTYGQINGLAGDFYGPQKPISDGADTSEQRELFLGAYYSLTSPSSLQPQEANNILSILQKEVDIVNNALYNHQDPSIAYAEMSHTTESLVIGWATASRFTSASSGPTYSTLLHDNLDHFGDDARLVYNIGHSIALNVAHDGDLEKAYTINAFADHYLEDLFTAGHLRTPRRFLHGRGLIGDLLSMHMHNEDNAIGLRVQNPRNLPKSGWVAYGDGRALDESNQANLDLCIEAVQASADEVYAVFAERGTGKPIPTSTNYKAWLIAPTLESARRNDQKLVPLFNQDGRRRQVLQNRKDWNFTSDYNAYFTMLQLQFSTFFRYPMALGGVPNVRPATGLSVLFTYGEAATLFLQNPAGGILQAKSAGYSKEWVLDDTAEFAAYPGSALASVGWDSGNETHIFYVKKNRTYMDDTRFSYGKWMAGGFSTPWKIKPIGPQAPIAAFSIGRGDIIRVFTQVAGAPNEIREYAWGSNSWSQGSTFKDVLEGTGIAALGWQQGGTIEIRVYYQDSSLKICEQMWSGGQWKTGYLTGLGHTGLACTPICASKYTNTRGDVLGLNIYFYNQQNQIVGLSSTNSWAGPGEVVTSSQTRISRLAATSWNGGAQSSVFFQNEEYSIVEAFKSVSPRTDWVERVVVPFTAA